ncbi:MAG: hypothetical protein MUD12_07055 [Spirochaetes bacterium]|jgi:hypothetical protein|nr:hypothetical protein [Spirochaetota bacterium]
MNNYELNKNLSLYKNSRKKTGSSYIPGRKKIYKDYKELDAVNAVVRMFRGQIINTQTDDKVIFNI